jgi:TRAP-type C4-dicarboxylate transport system substrate-binding protein
MTSTPKPHLAALTALAVIATGAGACSASGSQRSGSPSTSTTERITLRLGTDDSASTPGGEQVQHFAQEVARQSDGAITIEPVWHAGDGRPHWDQHVARTVVDGHLDLGMVPSRAWDDLGVKSLTALNAPFLVTTDTLTAAVVTDDKVSDLLVSGLPAVGVSALTLLPEGLRHPFGFDGVLGGPADYRGGVVRSPYSRTTEAMFQALGATPSDDDADPTTMVGAESSYRLSPAGEATGNVTFYPKVNVLVIADDARQRLSDDQMAVLQDAADATQTWDLDTLPTDAEAAATFCQEAGRIGSASQTDIDGLVTATRRVVDELRQDDTTAKVIDAIETIASQDPPAQPITGCPHQPSSSDQQLVDGTFTTSMTAEEARAAGVTDQARIDENAGDYVLTLEDGSWAAEQLYTTGPKKGQVWHGTGGYTVEGHHLTWYWSHEPGGYTEVDVDLAADGSLVFSNVVDGGDAEAQALSDAFFTTWKSKKG